MISSDIIDFLCHSFLSDVKIKLLKGKDTTNSYQSNERTSITRISFNCQIHLKILR